MRSTLEKQPHVKAAAVDYDEGLAYVLPEEGFDADKAVKAVGRSGKYSATVQ